MKGGIGTVAAEIATLALSALVGAVLAEPATRLSGRRIGVWPLALGAIAITATALHLSPAPLLAGLGLGWTLLLLAAVDVAALRLPDVATLPLAAAGLALSAIERWGWLGHAVGAGLGFAVLAGIDVLYRRLRGRSGLGLGDAKLFAAAGAWLGWAALPSVLLIACAAGLAWAAVRLVRGGRAAAGEPLPFGAPLALAIWAVWLLQWRQ